MSPKRRAQQHRVPSPCPAPGSRRSRTHHGDGGVELGDAHPARGVLAVEALVGEAAAVTGLHRRLRGVGVQVNELLTCPQGKDTSIECHRLRRAEIRGGGRAMAEPALITTQRNSHSRDSLLSATSPNASQPGTAGSTTTVATPL